MRQLAPENNMTDRRRRWRKSHLSLVVIVAIDVSAKKLSNAISQLAIKAAAVELKSIESRGCQVRMLTSSQDWTKSRFVFEHQHLSLTNEWMNFLLLAHYSFVFFSLSLSVSHNVKQLESYKTNITVNGRSLSHTDHSNTKREREREKNDSFICFEIIQPQFIGKHMQRQAWERWEQNWPRLKQDSFFCMLAAVFFLLLLRLPMLQDTNSRFFLFIREIFCERAQENTSLASSYGSFTSLFLPLSFARSLSLLFFTLTVLLPPPPSLERKERNEYE